jgi:hypothetical protein
MSLSGIRTYDPSIRASEDSSCLRPRDHWDRLAFERAKIVHALDRVATVIVSGVGYRLQIFHCILLNKPIHYIQGYFK